MSVLGYILISVIIIVVIVALYIIIFCKKIITPTQGKRIGEYENPRKALLVIDVQEDYTGINGKQPVPYKDVEEQIATINKLIDYASNSGIEVAYIRQTFDNNFVAHLLGGRAIEGQLGVEFDSRIRIVNKNDFTKKISDAFSNPRLEEFLFKNHVNEVYLVGLDAAYCVYYTALGAINRGYKVVLINDAIMTRKNMGDILKRYKKNDILLSSSKEMIEA